jgi:hypothetical protein
MSANNQEMDIDYNDEDRPSHPLTALVKEAKELQVKDLGCDLTDLTYETFTEMSCGSNDVGCFKTLLWDKVEDDEDWSGYCDKVLQDYHQIYLSYGVDGIWNDEMETRLQINKQQQLVCPYEEE